jgi:hypothetical protein
MIFTNPIVSAYINILGNIKMEHELKNGKSKMKLGKLCICSNNLVVEVIILNKGSKMKNG